MKNICLAALVAVSTLVAGCSKHEEAPSAEVIRPVKTILVGTPETGGIRRFPARIDALNKAELAFRVPGTVQTLLVKEGDRVKTGQQLLALDPTDYEIAVKDAEASFNRADRDFRRARELIEEGYISQSDYDLKEAQRKNSQAVLEKAMQDLDYTRLSAPFDGIVADRYVQQFEEVQAKQAVLAIHDNALLEVKIDVPENIILRMRPEPDQESNRNRVKVTASFENRPGEEFDLSVREIATRADPKTQTFEVTLTMPAPEDFLVFPGMTATVTADFSEITVNEGRLFLPATAVTSDTAMAPFVWTVDEASMSVRKTPVEVGRLTGHSIEIKSGLNVDSRVVTAGVGYLSEGMKVRLIASREEAEPRPDEVNTAAPQAVAPNKKTP